MADVDETSEAYEEGLRAGDLITEAGQEKVTSVGELEERIADAKEAGRNLVHCFDDLTVSVVAVTQTA